MPQGVARRGRTAVWLAAASALLVAAGCAGSGSARRAEPVGAAPGLAGLRLRVRRDPGPLDQEVGTALETELARAGASVLTDDRAPRDADVTVKLDLRSVGPVVEGIASASVERDGVLIDRVSTALDVYRRDRFPALVGQQLAQAIVASPRVASLRGGSPVQPVAVAPSPPANEAGAAPPGPPVQTYVPPPPPAPPASLAATPPVAAAPAAAAPSALGRSGRFGVGFSLELQTGLAQVFAPGGSPSGIWIALAAQVDMGPRAAFRLPLQIVAAGSGENGFAQIAFTPTYIYRFRYENEQPIVPYVGLGAKLMFVEAGRTFLGRPTGTATADSCSRRHSIGGSTTTDCSFAISPEPVAGIEWHATRLFALDIGASYSFAHLTSSAGAVSWIHLLSLFVAPRLSF